MAAEGLAIFRPRRSAVVVTFSARQLLDMYEVLTVLEGLCANLTARRMSDEERDDLVILHSKIEKLLKIQAV